MRTLLIASAAALFATSAFAVSPSVTANGTYSWTNTEVCSIADSVADEVITLGTAVKMDLTITCNTEFDIAVTGTGTGGAIEMTNIDNVESSTDYSDVIAGSFTIEAPNTNDTDVAGDYEADKDFDPNIQITFTGVAADLEAGNYEGDVTVTVTGTDVTS